MNADQVQKLTKFALWILAATLLISASLLHARLSANLDFDGENSLTEAESLYTLRCMRMGQPLYHDFSSPPHLLSQYTPLFYVVPGEAAKLLRADELETFVVGRCYCYALWCAVALATYGLARQAGGSPLGAAFGAMLWMAGSLAPRWANSYRPDSAAVFFSLASVWVYQRRSDRAHLACALFLSLAAFFHKQSAVAAVAAITIQEWKMGRLRQAFIGLAAWATAVAVGVVLAQVATQGLFMPNVFDSLARAWLPGLPFYFLAALTAAPAPLLAGAMSFIAPNHARSWLLKSYFAIALLLAFLSSAKSGSNVNYYLEPFALGCALTGLLVTDWLRRPVQGGREIGVRMAWIAVALGSCIGTLQGRCIEFRDWWREGVVEHRTVRRKEAAAWAEVTNYLAGLQEPILIEDPYLVLRRGNVPFMMNVGTFGDMARTGNFNDAEIVSRIKEGGFTAIVTTYPLGDIQHHRLLPAKWIDLAQTNYQLAHQFTATGIGFQDVYVYLPRGTSRPKPTAEAVTERPTMDSLRAITSAAVDWLERPPVTFWRINRAQGPEIPWRRIRVHKLNTSTLTCSSSFAIVRWTD